MQDAGKKAALGVHGSLCHDKCTQRQSQVREKNNPPHFVTTETVGGTDMVAHVCGHREGERGGGRNGLVYVQ